MGEDYADSAIIYYITGYIANALLKESCNQCATLISPGKVYPVAEEELKV